MPLLQIRKGLDDAKGFRFRFDDGFDCAAGDDENVKFSEPLESSFVVAMGAEGGSLGGDGVFFFCGEDGLEGFGC